MNNDEEAEIKLPKSHPHLAMLIIGPAGSHRFEQMADDRPEVKIRNLDRSKPDHWTVYVACASASVGDLLENAW